MQSESSRVTTAREAAFRSHYRQSTGRLASLIALDRASEALVAAAVAALPDRRRAVVLPKTALGDGWIADLRAQAQALLDDASRADLVVLLAQAGADCQAGALFGEEAQPTRQSMLTPDKIWIAAPAAPPRNDGFGGVYPKNARNCSITNSGRSRTEA